MWQLDRPQNNCNDESVSGDVPSPQGPNNLDTHVQKHQCGPYLPPDSKELRVQNLETQVIKPLRENIGVAICDYDKAMISKIQCPKHQQQKTDNR